MKEAAQVTSSTAAKQNPLVSVITVVFNGAESIEQTILSVIGQTYNNIEYIVIDGGSTDGTTGVIQNHEHAIDNWVSESDQGIYDAMNKGIRLASGDWIIFMNSGDTFVKPTILSDLTSYLSGSADVIYGSIEIRYPDNESSVVPSRKIRIPLRGLPTWHQAMIIRTSWLKRSPYMQSYNLAADYENLCYIMSHGGRAMQVQDVIAAVSSGGVSMMQRLDVFRQYEEIYNSYYRKSLSSTIYYMRHKYTELLRTTLRKFAFAKYLNFCR